MTDSRKRYYLWEGDESGGSTVISNGGVSIEEALRIARRDLDDYGPLKFRSNQDGGFTLFGKFGVRAKANLPK